ncbi:MAG: leucyl aminopeptidase family protein, partial [Pseudomonadota bacterium]
MHPAFTDTSADAIPIWLFDPDSWADGTSKLSKNTRGFAAALGFSGATGDVVRAPNETGDGLGAVLFGLGAGTDGLGLATLSAALPSGDYEIAEHDGKRSLEQLAAGWADGAYRFQRYKSRGDASPRLVLPEAIDVEGAGREATAVDLVRDLVNTPAEDMGPDGLQEIVSDLAQAHGADFSATIGDELLHAGYPMVHAVGRAAAKAPRMLELAWGDPDAPLLAIVGKGVCFDTGGLNLKTGNYMRDMKKDMGGAAHAIALAGLIMDAGLPVRLKLYVPAVENAVGGGAFRPGDVLKTRKGLIVEIDNTDAEGRLILSDALTKACEDQTPDLLLDYATLTGAARVALGAELAPFYTDD